MNHENPNDPTRETAAVDGSDLTEAEAALVAEGLEEKPDDGQDPPAGGAEGADGTAPAAAAGDEAAAAAAQAEADDQAAAERQAAEERAAAAAAAPPAAAPAPPAAELPAKPEAPKDFDAEFKALDDRLNDGAMTSEEYNAAHRALSREEGRYEAQVTLWEGRKADHDRQAQELATRAEADWNTAALAFEANPDNKDLLGNPLRANLLQQSIEQEDARARAEGRTLSPADLLNAAAKITREAFNLPAPGAAADPTKNPATQVRDAVGARKPAAAPTTLGDLPTAGQDPIRGNEAYGELDGLGIEALEEQVQGMSPAAVEKFLRAAPGANSNGRGSDPDE